MRRAAAANMKCGELLIIGGTGGLFWCKCVVSFDTKMSLKLLQKLTDLRHL